MQRPLVTKRPTPSLTYRLSVDMVAAHLLLCVVGVVTIYFGWVFWLCSLVGFRPS